MPFLDHLEELRWRLLKSLLAVALGTALGWFLVQHFDVLGLLKRPIAPFLPDGRLVFTSPTEPLVLTLKLAFVAGLVAASPVLVYQAWAFLAPALYARERRVIGPALTVGILLFMGGALACYRWVLPAALEVLFQFQRNDLAAFITVDRYFSFATQLIVAFGVVAELPLVVTILAAFGVVTPQFLARHRRYAIVIAAVVAAFLTPPDALSMLLMLGPLLLLYEVSILGAWIVTRRRTPTAGGSGTAALVLWLAIAAAGGAGRLDAQAPTRPDSAPARGQAPTGNRDSMPRAGRPVDTSAARRLGLPTGPTRTFPAADPVLDSLLRLSGYRVTRYVADTLVVEGEPQTIMLRGEAFVDRDGTKLEADSIRYREASCRLDAYGSPRLFDRTTVLVGDAMRYDTCLRRGVVVQALTDFKQGGATWYMRGNLAVDSNSTRLYGASSEVTTCELPVPHYHFAAREVKWINQGVMVARPAVLFIRDVPILWLPFIVQDTRSGRRSGLLVPRFGLNDLVRQGRGYQRHVGNVGYYFVLNNYSDILFSSDWYAGRSFTLRGQGHYRWLNRFMTGGVSYSRLQQLDQTASSSQIIWQHNQSFDSRTQLNVSLNYATSASVVQRNTVDPLLTTAQLSSNGSFSKRFSWGTVTLGASRQQNLQNDQVSQTFPNISLTPAPVNITPAITWSPGFSLVTTQNFHVGPTLIPIPGPAAPDTFAHFYDDRLTSLSFGTPLRVGRWNWSNNLSVTDRLSSQRQTFLLPDSTVPGGVRRVLYGRTFSTAVEWQTGINLPQIFSGTWRLQPGLSIVNSTGAGPFMLRNQFSNGVFVRQGKRLQFGLGMRPTLFAFFPGIGPLQRIRHTFSPLIDYRYAPGAAVPDEYARALDPERTNPNVRSDPQQTISVGLAQNFEAKLRRAPGDSAEPRKIRILGLQTGAIGYNFEQARDSGRTGWTTQSLTNTFASDLLAGFSLQITHDLWRGLVGSDTSRFDPFLQSVSASFAVTPATLHGIGALFGLGRRQAPPGPAVPGDTTRGGAAGTGLGGTVFGPGPGASRGFSLGLNYTSTRTRGDTTLVGVGGRQSMNLSLSFSPTPGWDVRWSSTYDVDLHRFNQHVVQLERDLHRWHASFGYTRTATGSASFTFLVALRDQPDIKFDYDQQTFVQ